MKKNILKAVSDVIIDKDCVWIISDTFNGLLKYSFAKDELDLICMYPDSIGTKRAAFSKIIKVQNEIFFIPLTATDIFYYKLNEGKFYKLNIPSKYFYTNKNIHVIEYKSYIYCINRFTDLIIKIDSVTKHVSIFIAPVIDGRDEEIEKEIYRLYKAPCLYENKIIWSNYDELLTIFDLRSETFVTIPVKGLTYSETRLKTSREFPQKTLKDWIIGVRAYKSILWLFTFEGQVYQYNQGKIDKIGKDEFKEESSIFFDNNKNLILPFFYDLISVDDELWFIPQYRNHCIKFNANNKWEIVLEEYKQIWDENPREYSLCKVIDKKILLFSYYEDYFYIFDTEKRQVYRRKLEIELHKFVRNNFECRKSMMLNAFYGLDDLISLFFLVNDEKRKLETERSNIGKIVHESMKKIT